MLFTEGVFTPQELDDRRAVDVLMAATDHANELIRPRDILYAAVKGGDQGVLSVLTRTLEDGAEPHHITECIDLIEPPRGGILDVRSHHFSDAAAAALEEFEAELAGSSRLRESALELVTACALAHLDPGDRELLQILDVDRAATALRERAHLGVAEPPPLVDTASGRLRSEEFSAAAWGCLEQAGEQAARLGYDQVMAPHCFLALLAQSEGPAEQLVRLQIPPQVGLAKVAETVAAAFRLTDRQGEQPLALREATLGDSLLSLLERARRSAAIWGEDRVDTEHLLDALLADMPVRLESVLQAEPLCVNLARMREQLELRIRRLRGRPHREIAFRLPDTLVPNEDLTWLARTKEQTPALHLDRYFEVLGRALHRTVANHILITGPSGCGRTTLLRELARRAATGQIGFLSRKRFLYVDCADVPAARGGEVLTKLIATVSGRTDLIVCVDGLDALLRGGTGGDHRLILRSALKDRRIHLIGVLPHHAYEDMLAADRTFTELTTRIEMVEPEPAAARDMVRRAADELAEEFGVAVHDEAVDRAIAYCADYIPNEGLPRVAVKALRRACEDLRYRRVELDEDATELTSADVVTVVAEISGVPAGQISGKGGEPGALERSLGELVVGQADAIRAVAGELRRIKAGLTTSKGPASVMFFAGLTGVGKTELAKTIARFYSASKKLQTYPMENFTERHSVSGIIGSPPGYVGYADGGRLINDLNADPYCVFLLDEAEKAHPDVWRPFLNLFDEGWITDQRGVKAFGDRAIFILTSNAGHDIIERMSREGQPAEAIARELREQLRRERHPQSGQPVFPPEFLGRIRRLVVFRPLDRDAMAGIARNILNEKRQWWLDRRGKDLEVSETLIDLIAAETHAEYVASRGAEGGRAVGKLIAEQIEEPLLEEAEKRPADYERCTGIRLAFRPARTPREPLRSRIEVIFHEPA